MRARLALVVFAVALAVVLFMVARSVGHGPASSLVLAAGPLLCPGLPAALLLWAGRGGRNPYEVRRPLNPERWREPH